MLHKSLSSRFVRKIMSWFIGSEGFIHIILSSIAFWGMISYHVTDFRIWLAPSFDFVMGFGGILTGIVLHMTTRKHSANPDGDTL